MLLILFWLNTTYFPWKLRRLWLKNKTFIFDIFFFHIFITLNWIERQFIEKYFYSIIFCFLDFSRNMMSTILIWSLYQVTVGKKCLQCINIFCKYIVVIVDYSFSQAASWNLLYTNSILLPIDYRDSFWCFKKKKQISWFRSFISFFISQNLPVNFNFRM